MKKCWKSRLIYTVRCTDPVSKDIKHPLYKSTFYIDFIRKINQFRINTEGVRHARFSIKDKTITKLLLEKLSDRRSIHTVRCKEPASKDIKHTCTSRRSTLTLFGK